MLYEMKKIDLWSAIKISFMVNAIIGLCFGLLIGLIITFFIAVVGQMVPAEASDFPALPFGIMGGFFVGMVYAVIIAIFNGVIFTSIAVILYNLFSGWLGGIKIDFKPADSAELKSTMTLATEQGNPPPVQDSNV